MRFLSLFSGIEAASAAWLPLGWECVGVAEIEPFPRAVLAHHYPDVPNLGDITKITEAQIASLGRIDLIVGGFPCQDLSIAGKRKGLKNADGSTTRSGLFFDAMRLVGHARQHCGLRYLLIENVPGLYSSNNGRDFAAVVGEMVGSGFNVPPNGWGSSGCAIGPGGMVEWRCLDAQFFGLAQRRKRVFAIADFGDWRNRAPILLERESLRGDPAPRREARKDVAPTISSRPTGGGGLGTDFDLDGGLIAAIQERAVSENSAAGPDGVGVRTDGVAYTLEARQTVQAVAYGGNNQSGEGFDASEDGTGRGTPLVPVAFDTTQITSAANYSNPKLGGPCHPLAAGAHAPAVAFALRGRDDGAQPEMHGDGDSIGALCAAGGGSSRDYLAARSAVRRLTPEECEALQGFPRRYTAIPYRGGVAADGPRYKALGNSFAVPVVRWIGYRIAAADRIL